MSKAKKPLKIVVNVHKVPHPNPQEAINLVASIVANQLKSEKMS